MAINSTKIRYQGMSHTDGNTFGLEHGKIGDRIAVVLNGKQIYKGLYKPTNPRTPKQQMHRAKLAFVNQLSKVLAEAVNLGFAMVPQSGSGMTARNAFVKTNWDNGALVWLEREEEAASVDAPKDSKDGSNGLTGEWAVVPQRLVLANGPRYIGRGMTATVRDGRLHIGCSDSGLNDPHAVKDDRLMVAVYRPTVPTVCLCEGPLRSDCRECSFDLPTDAVSEEEMMHVYTWFQATAYHRAGNGKVTVRPRQASPSVYLGGFQA